MELYKISQDISERENIADKQPDIVKEMSDLFDEARTESEIWKLKG
jgi:hypothetical protein